MTLGWNTSVGSYWSRDDDIAFETALAFYDDERKICWDSIAEVVPGKTTAHIIDHYNNLIRDVMDIESGRVPLPDYRVPEEPNPNARGKRKLKHKRQKGVSWTLDEHRQFLIGLAKYGKGDWRSISRNSVRTRTPTQVASHAQKYFERLNSKNKHRNRASIHDITVDEENRNISPKQGAIGTWDDDIAFETALAFYDDERKICWDSIAEVVPGKTTAHIIDHYNNLIRDVMDIESGRVPLPDYRVPEEPNPNARGKRKLKHKRQKGVSWTLDEHRQFLIGLAKYGKGDWRSISRNSVRTRTPTQVASHAQKYFERLNSKNKHRNRASIHDITVDEENRNISPKQGAIGTWQNGNVNLASASNNQAIQTNSQPSLDLPIHGRPNNLWNTQAISQPSLNLPTYGAPPIWNAQAALPPPPASIPVYGTTLSTMNQPMVGQMPSHFGTNMNHFAQPHMTPGVQPYPLPSYPGPRAPINMGSSIPYGDMTYANKSQR
ncbi:PREDICTED: uncharacterized protein LOC104772496 [Camelina sativa]|uniref:Uncharacterized protein LOC104772496 n=1 Tax=Camelina sativa TaxID=90675 RepID=A0ABM0Y4M0_CAMSA|nr:PREDICTED: uncharacterized protein LOC104772496 [Camelina sativa]